MNDTTRLAHRLLRDGRIPGLPDPAVPSRPQVLAGGRSSLPDVRRRPLRQRIDRVVATVASGLIVVDPRSALAATGTLGTSPADRPGRIRDDSLVIDGRADA